MWQEHLLYGITRVRFDNTSKSLIRLTERKYVPSDQITFSLNGQYL